MRENGFLLTTFGMVVYGLRGYSKIHIHVVKWVDTIPK